MNGRPSKALSVLVVSGAFSCVFVARAHAQCVDPAARIVSVANQVQHKSSSSAVFVPAAVNLNVCVGDSIRAGARSRATVEFLPDGVVLAIEQNTEWVLRSPIQPGRSFIDLIRGAILFFTRQPRSLDVQTPFVNAAVQGTEFLVRVEQDRAVVTVLEGRVALTNASGSLVVANNQTAVAAAGQAPQLQVVVRPRDAVQWAIYYQPVLPADSFQQVEQIPDAQRDALFYVRRAGLLLGVGRHDEARADIKQALALNPNDGDAYALLAVVAVALNDKAGALINGREAVARSPQSAAARIALSYALQANFELEAARNELLQAVTDSPNDASAWARLAEVWLSLGYRDQAVRASERAASLTPNVARTNVVLGFAALAQVDTAGARSAFERALALESGSPLARLGLGLAKIRDGDLDAGRRDIEIAAALNPNDSIIRSYLGKAYFEERRDALPANQFDLAKELDAQDPTPWFYDAIRKQTLNRPVEALQDLQRSIELNGNRAVYRSRMLLDQDLAARSASLGRIYRDLGFEQLALVEGWNSVNNEAGDHSGHRFLADVYSALPRHEIARVSELLQSQLLQPSNINAVQPQLAETNLSILAGSGPAEPAFNEFNPLFNRDRLSLLAAGVAGNDSTLGGEVTVSGVWNRLSFSVGQVHFDTDGFRENNAQDRDVGNVFLQGTFSPSSSIQGEVRWTSNVRGDLLLRFDPAQVHPSADADDRFRLGAAGWPPRVQSPLRGHRLLHLSAAWRDRFDDEIEELGFPGSPGSLAIDVRLKGRTTEIQHLFTSERFRVISGLGHFDANRDETVDVGIQLPVPPFAIASSTSEEFPISHTNAYVYSQLDMAPSLTLSLGSSGDFLDGRGIEVNQFNPKAGLSWQPTRTTTLRAAGFRTLHRSLISNQTIEPTQVAGFNQLYDGVEGEEAWRYGLGLDQKLGRRLFTGAEVSWRDLTTPTVSVEDTEVVRDSWTEQFGRAYLYATPHSHVGLSLEYLYERFRREGNLGDEQIAKLGTDRVPLGIG